jgi:peptidoglycan hydrolase-like protein with peptidoglycan-binding domain
VTAKGKSQVADAATVAFGTQGAAVKTLQDKLSKAGLLVPTAETTQSAFGAGTREAVVQFQSQFRLAPTGKLDAVSSAMLDAAASAAAANKAILTGRVAMDYGAPANGLRLKLYNIGFAGATTAVAEATTDANGVYSFAYAAPSAGANLEVRALDAKGNETPISQVQFGAASRSTLNLVAPVQVQPLAPEYDRLAADMKQQIGGVEQLANAKESGQQRDLTLVSHASNWDARLVALAALAEQSAKPTGLGGNVLYALYRVGLPTDTQQLALVSSDSVEAALSRACQSGIIALNADQLKSTTAAFQAFATRTRLAMTAPGAVSSFQDILTGVVTDTTQQAAFANLFFSDGSNSADIWTKAAQLNIPPATIAALQVQGRLLYLTFNNAALAQALQTRIGSVDKLSALVDADFHESATWKTQLTTLAGSGGTDALAKLIPASYTQANVADRLDAYAGDLARLVRLSFPTQVVARMLDQQQLTVGQGNAGQVSAFLRSAAPLGFALGKTPLNAFIREQGNKLPTLDSAGTESLKDIQRIYQLTPSNESMQVAIAQGLTSAYSIASLSKDAFMSKYGALFPSAGEASLVYGKAQQISSVTFNFYTMAKQLDTAPPVYGLSAGSDARTAAKDAVVKQFPIMASLFGNLDFCQCDECRSVLSPAAYMVDLLEFLRKSAPNAKGYTPLDILIGKDATVPGRRPDIGALPLTCANTNTAMPYIDLVNEIFEYFVANNRLDARAITDVGDATTEDLTAEPQRIVASVYSTTLNQATYPLGLPFDLWIETVRGFLNYFNAPLAQLLETLRPADRMELYTDADNHPYYRAQVFAEQLGLSPAEYAVLTVTDLASNAPSVAHWFALYGYLDEATALNGKPDPTDATKFLIEPLRSAKQLSQVLGISYQDVVDLVESAFLNPALDKLIFQFNRFGISLPDAFAYTGQPGTTPLSAQAKTDFEAQLAAVTQRYQTSNPGFDAKAWLTALLPVGYASGVWVLNDPDSGCDFTATTLQHADGSALTPLDFLKLNLFVRLWQKLGWSIEEVSRVLVAFFPTTPLPNWTDAGFAAAYSAAWKTALVNLAHLDTIERTLKPALGRAALLPIWTNLPVQGANPLYAQLFLTGSVLTNDPTFDSPTGDFPSNSGDFLSTHLPAVLGELGLTADEATAILSEAGAATVTKVVGGQTIVAPAFTLANLSICYRYSLLAKSLGMAVADLIALKRLSGLDIMRPPVGTAFTGLADDVLFTQTLTFLEQVAAVNASGFDVADLQYLLRQSYDPAGPYAPDANAQTGFAQSIATGLRQIAAQNALPANSNAVSDDVLQQRLASLLPAQVLQTLLLLLGNGKSFSGAQGGVAPAAKLDPTPFTQEGALSFSYDATTQTQSVTYHGVLLDWKKAQLLQISNTPLLSALLGAVQQQGIATFAAAIGDVLGVWSSLVQYEAVQTGIATPVNAAPLMAADAGLTLSYDQADQLLWLGCRGVLTDDRKAALTAIDASATLGALLAAVQAQAMPAYRAVMGTMLTALAQAQSFVATAIAVAPANAIDANVFAAHPQVQFGYDSTTQTQTLTCQGILSDADRVALAALLPTSTVLPGLLQDVRNQAINLFLGYAAHLISVTAADLDPLAQAVAGLNGGNLQRQAKAALLEAFQPLTADKLSRQFVVQSVAAALSADPTLTETLLTEASLLNDPLHAGTSLLPAYLSAGAQGVTATYFAAPDGSGTPLATGMAASVDLADPTNPNAGKAGTGSAQFEGYLQVPADGPYRFFGGLGNTGARVTLRLVSPDPTALLPNPVLDMTAAANGDEASQFVALQGGVAYRFTAAFTTLGAAGARLLIQGETLAKGPLSQVVLSPAAGVDGLIRAQTLVAKVVQILQTFGLGERELTYLVANSARFGDLRLSALPTQSSDDTPVRAVSLFQQFLALAEYAALRNGPLGSTDGLISVFENVGAAYTEAIGSGASNANSATPWTRLANLTRRDPQTVRDLGIALGLITQATAAGNYQITALPDFASARGMSRLWAALVVAQLIGVSVPSLLGATLIVCSTPPAGAPPPNALAAMLKNAVRARYDIKAWRPVAKSVFDKLRQKKRDALVAFLVNTLTLEGSNQLFEYFLIDPGMEPVVQTSPVRLALSSLQTFIQRITLGYETGDPAHPERNILPSAIDIDWWTWMKRYRVWESNREIFLFPENWMEPELRLDKTDLFQQLESALTQGEVNRNLAESAFLDYLKGLDTRARLDIVASYLDQDTTHPGLSTLHVIGRTYGKPHKYFYRSYAEGSWSAWIAVPLDIEGDHIVLAVWRGKLNLFWLTFVTRQQGAPAPSGSDSTTVANLSFTSLADKIYAASAQKQIEVQLNWSEYFQNTWSERLSTDIDKSDIINVLAAFDPSQVHLHISKEPDDAALLVHLDFPEIYDIIYIISVIIAILSGRDPSTVMRANHAFRITSKNSDPAFSGTLWSAPPEMPYNAPGVDATTYEGTGSLQSSFQSEITTTSSQTETEQILQTVHDFGIVATANAIAPPFLDPSEPDYWEAGALVSPFFFKDRAHSANTSEMTYFVQPSLTEVTLTEWVGWAIPPAIGGATLKPWLDGVTIVAQVPRSPIPIDPGDPTEAIYAVKSQADWTTNPATAIAYGDTYVGANGGINPTTVGVSANVTRVVTALANGFSLPSMPAGSLAARQQVLLGASGLNESRLQLLKLAQQAAQGDTAMLTSAMALRQLERT